jgi:hypothetical protein
MKRVLTGVAMVAIMVTLTATGDPIRQGNQPPQYMQGQIYRVDAANGTVSVRSGTGATAKESTFQVNDATKYWGTDRKAFDNGLRYQGFKPGTDIWYVPGTGDNARYFSQVHFYDPTVPAPK